MIRKKSIVLICLNLLAVQAFGGIDLYHQFSYDSSQLETPKLFYAKYPTNINSNRLLVVRSSGGFTVGIDLNYLTPYDNQLDYAIEDPFIILGPIGLPVAPSPLARIRAIQPHDNFGYGGEVSYTFPNSGTDLLFHYQTFSDSSSSKLQAPDGGTLWNVLSIYGLSVHSDSATSRSSYEFDQADLSIGNEIVVGRNFILHPYFGAAYVKISKNMRTNYINAFTETGFAEEETFVGDAIVDSNSYFRGLGPRIGVDAEYLFTPNFGLITHTNTSLYLGIINSDVRETTSLGGDDFFDVARIHQENVDRVVPALEGKLGLAYRWPCAKLKIEAGYQASHYFNAVNSYRAGEFILNLNYLKNPHDFNLYGPYLNVSLYDLPHTCEIACAPFHVGSLRTPGGVEFALGILRLTPELNQLDYGVLDPDPVFDAGSFTHPSDRSKVLINQPGVDWGWQADFAYHFPCTAFDIRANFQTLLERDSEHVIPREGVIFNTLSMVADVANAPIVSDSVISKIRLEYNKLDLDIGQLMGSCPNWRFRLFGGARYTNIESKFETLYHDMSDLNNNSGFSGDGYVLQDNTVEGIGPRFGGKLEFRFTNNFSLIAEGGGAILVADKQSTYRDVEPDNPLTAFPQTIYEERESSEDEIVPNLDAKFALNAHTCYHTHVIGVELGYLVNHYFNASSRYKSTISRAAGLKQVSDIDLHGYYLNLSVGGTPPNCRPVVEPFGNSEFVGGLEFGVEVLFLQVTSPYLDYAVKDPNPALPTGPFLLGEFVPGPNSEVVKTQPHSDSGYRFHLGYAFPCSTFDVALNYLYYNNDKSSATGAPEDGVIWMLSSPARNGSSAPWFAQTANAKFSFSSRNTNVEFAKNIKIDRLNLRFLTGGSYLHADQTRTITYTGVTSRSFLPVGDSSILESHEYKGLGPRFGLDSSLEIGGGFGFVGHAAENFYVGIVTNDHLEDNNPGTGSVATPAFDTTLLTKKRNRLVTELELKVGADYVIPLCNSFITLEAGYECDHYFNLFDFMRYTTEFSQGFVKHESDVSLTGPYIKAQITF